MASNVYNYPRRNIMCPQVLISQPEKHPNQTNIRQCESCLKKKKIAVDIMLLSTKIPHCLNSHKVKKLFVLKFFNTDEPP